MGMSSGGTENVSVVSLAVALLGAGAAAGAASVPSFFSAASTRLALAMASSMGTGASGPSTTTLRTALTQRYIGMCCLTGGGGSLAPLPRRPRPRQPPLVGAGVAIGALDSSPVLSSPTSVPSPAAPVATPSSPSSPTPSAFAGCVAAAAAAAAAASASLALSCLVAHRPRRLLPLLIRRLMIICCQLNMRGDHRPYINKTQPFRPPASVHP